MLIREGVEKALKTDNVDAVITCGGTGISRTDVTIEAIGILLEKEIPGFGEMLRNLSHKKIGSAAILTRAIAGVSHGKAIFCLPGSPHAVSLGVNKLVLPEVGHILFHALK
jgi:molybdenum cofactor biosynthesis protein B